MQRRPQLDHRSELRIFPDVQARDLNPESNNDPNAFTPANDTVQVDSQDMGNA